MARVFISYRRDDSIDVAGRMYDRLVAHFGRESVFKDVDSIPPGRDFRRHLHQAVQECDVLLAVIGCDWLHVHNERGEPRLHDDRDFVRIEIEAALQRDIPVIPVLVRGGTMPHSGELPSSLHDLVYRQAMLVRPDPDFHRDMDRLIAALDAASSTAAMSPPGGASQSESPQRTAPAPAIAERPGRLTNSLDNVLVRVPKEYLPGIRDADEVLYVSTTAVSNRDYRAFINGCSEAVPPRPPRNQLEQRVWDGRDCPEPVLDHPVVFVSPLDAIAFCT
ncbi:MAG TPA: TIR domain-containing protein, partial [Planctomycetaceae bacterium]|nr:TIR domain-containing protein [Planctomycetaceae bacterium]